MDRLWLPDLFRRHLFRWAGACCVALALAAVSGCTRDPGNQEATLGELSDANGEASPGAAQASVQDPRQASQLARGSTEAHVFSSVPDLPDQFRREAIQLSPGGFVQRPPIASASTSASASSNRARPAEPVLKFSQPFAGQTELAVFDHSPFPFNGSRPSSDEPFFNVREQGWLGHRTSSGRVYWAHQTYRERRSLLHIPEGFDPDKPSVLVLFFHGHRASLERDVRDRYLVAQQITASGMNAVVVAPHFAIEANDSSIGRFWETGFMRLYLEEAAQKLAQMISRADKRLVFERMPIIIVGYSGGFEAAGQALAHSGIRDRIRGVVLLDAAYGRFDGFSQWMRTTPQGFFLSAYTSSTARGNRLLMAMVSEAGQGLRTQMPAQLLPGARVFISAPVSHENYVTEAWAPYPLADLLRRLPDLPRRKEAAAHFTSSLPNRLQN